MYWWWCKARQGALSWEATKNLVFLNISGPGNDGLSLTPTPELWTCAGRLGHGLVGHRHGEGGSQELGTPAFTCGSYVGGEETSTRFRELRSFLAFHGWGDHSCFR